MNDLREEVMMQLSLTGRLVRRRLMWASHLVRMEEGHLPKKTAKSKEIRNEEGIREEGDKWREKAVDREMWEGIREEGDKWGREKAVDREKWEGITEERGKWREKAVDREK